MTLIRELLINTRTDGEHVVITSKMIIDIIESFREESNELLIRDSKIYCTKRLIDKYNINYNPTDQYQDKYLCNSLESNTGIHASIIVKKIVIRNGTVIVKGTMYRSIYFKNMIDPVNDVNLMYYRSAPMLDYFNYTGYGVRIYGISIPYQVVRSFITHQKEFTETVVDPRNGQDQEDAINIVYHLISSRSYDPRIVPVSVISMLGIWNRMIDQKSILTNVSRSNMKHIINIAMKLGISDYIAEHLTTSADILLDTLFANRFFTSQLNHETYMKMIRRCNTFRSYKIYDTYQQALSKVKRVYVIELFRNFNIKFMNILLKGCTMTDNGSIIYPSTYDPSMNLLVDTYIRQRNLNLVGDINEQTIIYLCESYFIRKADVVNYINSTGHVVISNPEFYYEFADYINENVIIELRTNKIKPRSLNEIKRWKITCINNLFRNMKYTYINMYDYPYITNVTSINGAFVNCYNLDISCLDFIYNKFSAEDLISAFNMSNLLPVLMSRLGYSAKNDRTIFEMTDIIEYRPDELYHIFFRGYWYRLITSEIEYMIKSHKFIYTNQELKDDEYALLVYNDEYENNKTRDRCITFFP
jgi:hypothetical protein